MSPSKDSQFDPLGLANVFQAGIQAMGIPTPKEGIEEFVNMKYRIDQLEKVVEKQTKLIDKLNEKIKKQGKRISVTKTDLKKIKAKIRETSSSYHQQQQQSEIYPGPSDLSKSSGTLADRLKLRMRTK